MSLDIIFSTATDTQNNKLAIVTLNRLESLNALSSDMFLRLNVQLHQWENDSSIKAVLIKSSSKKAFCAGGDIRAIYQNKDKGADALIDYFQLEYETDKYISHYKKPIIALINGITMGGGIGISIHADYTVAADNLRFAMPETIIGFFPDVGASYYLSRLPNHIGTYLALTGREIDAASAHYLKLVDRVVSYNHFAQIEKKLTQTPFTADESFVIPQILDEAKIENLHSPHFDEETMNCFSHTSVEDIMAALSNNPAKDAASIRNDLTQRSPTSLKVTLAQLHAAKHMVLDDVFAMDTTIAYRMLQKPDFYEGIRAAIIDKDKTPHWNPASLHEVTETMVKEYFHG